MSARARHREAREEVQRLSRYVRNFRLTRQHWDRIDADTYAGLLRDLKAARDRLRATFREVLREAS